MGRDSLTLTPAAERARNDFDKVVGELEVMRSLALPPVESVKLTNAPQTEPLNTPNVVAALKDSSPKL